MHSGNRLARIDWVVDKALNLLGTPAVIKTVYSSDGV